MVRAWWEAIRLLRVVTDSDGHAEVVWKRGLDQGCTWGPGLGQCGQFPVPKGKGRRSRPPAVASLDTSCQALGPWGDKPLECDEPSPRGPGGSWPFSPSLTHLPAPALASGSCPPPHPGSPLGRVSLALLSQCAFILGLQLTSCQGS